LGQWGPLLKSCAEGKLKKFSDIPNGGPNQPRIDRLDRTLLMLAIQYGNHTLAKQLIEQEKWSGLNAEDRDGDTALVYAVMFRHVDLVEQLLHKDVKLRTGSDKKFRAYNMAKLETKSGRFRRMFDSTLDSDYVDHEMETIKQLLLAADSRFAI
jgi:ankyrin repeat protein